jgi:NAD(P)-dependent dehydrogenase (short-subunit alcohol dehydrogenase family)
LATARRFIADGAQVVVTGRNQEALDAAVAELGDRATGIRGDVANLEDLDRLFAQVREQFGRVDVLFANAGIAPFVPSEAVTEEHFDRLFNINVRGLFFTVQKALPLLSEGASVILNASVVAQSGLPNTSIYSATKAAVRSLGRTLAAELSPRGIRVNVVSPGLIETPFWGKVGLSQDEVDAFGEQVVGQTPLGRPGKPEEIAATVAFLASDDASYFTGADLVADGGMIQV